VLTFITVQPTPANMAALWWPALISDLTEAAGSLFRHHASDGREGHGGVRHGARCL